MSKLPQAIHHLPEKPIHGNYIILGQGRWSTAENLSEAYNGWRRSGSLFRKDTVILDVSNDFKISKMDGEVNATKVKEVFRKS